MSGSSRGRGAAWAAPVGGALTIFVALGAQVRAAEPATAIAGSDTVPLGSPDFYPSAEHPVGWRGDGTGHFPGATPPLTWGRTLDGRSSNIVWETPMPSDSGASAIVVGDKILVTSQGYDLVCVDKKTGKILWMRSVSPYDAVSKDEAERAAAPEIFRQVDELAAKRDAIAAEIVNGNPGAIQEKGAAKRTIEAEMDKLMKRADAKKYCPFRSGGDFRIEDGGPANPTPASDGRHVYVFNGMGVTACYGLNGEREWIIYEPLGVKGEHGIFCSPALVDDMVVVAPGGARYIVYDKATGRRIREDKLAAAMACASPVVLRADSRAYVVDSAAGLRRASDGQEICPRLTLGPSNISTPVWGGGYVFYLVPNPNRWQDPPVWCYKLPANVDAGFKPTLIKAEYPWQEDQAKWGNNYSLTSSPLYHEGLLYVVSNSGKLYVFDIERAALLYSQDLEITTKTGPGGGRPYDCGVSASPVLGGKHIFITGNEGSTVVIEPGRTFKMVARNSIARIHQLRYSWKTDFQESTISSAFLDGKQLFYRAERFLYCIGGLTP